MNTFRRSAFLCIGITFVVVAGLSEARGQWIAPPEPRNLIHVSSTAEIRVEPNEVDLRLGIESRSPELDAAVKQNDASTAAVLRFLKDSGIAAKDVQTDFVEIHPNYDSSRGHNVVPDYYLVRRNFGVRLRKVAQFDALLSGAIKHGANHVIGIEFRTTELRKHRDAARQQAIRAAKEKAEALAKELEIKVGKATNIQEQTGGGYWGWSGGRNYLANAMSQNVSQVAAGGGESGEGNLAVGMISVTATVNVTFALQ